MTWLAVQTLCRPCDYLLVRPSSEEPCFKVANELLRVREVGLRSLLRNVHTWAWRTQWIIGAIFDVREGIGSKLVDFTLETCRSCRY